MGGGPHDSSTLGRDCRAFIIYRDINRGKFWQTVMPLAGICMCGTLFEYKCRDFFFVRSAKELARGGGGVLARRKWLQPQSW